ncbi:LLM class flavin-dependent oxidoreductase [Oceanobacillus sp. FSL W7-1309]|uniref:LLM class flavin-dependent oxidoreductase n=1 Tax=Oceanobacillus sp. FSL W7-1309 TaxID=2954539 RepID=UPI0030F59CBA|nr:LLM class flavin-dependent oxidoreductase [Oceanobacillus sp.]
MKGLKTVEKKQIALGVFLMGTGHHMASWRHPDVPADGFEDFNFYREVAEIAEKGKLDMIFLSDGLSFHRLSHPAELVRLDPLTLLPALAAVTKKIGLAATASTTYNEPFHLARKFASLDHISNGRSAWNVVTSYYEHEASNFSKKEHLAHDLRYERAGEFVEVVKGLWDSWEDGVLIRDKESGVYFNSDKLHSLNHEGKHFSVKGPLNASRSPQGHPVIVQAGSSEAGTTLAAQTADVIFTAQQTLEGAQQFYKKVKKKVIASGRKPDEVKIMPGVSPFIGRTEAEAKEKYEQLQDLIVSEIGLDFLSDYLGGMDFSNLSLDDQLPDEIPKTNGNQSRRKLIIELARRENLTIRELYKRIAGARGHFTIFGTPEQIADQLEAWIVAEGADGFNLMPQYLPGGLSEFVEQVIPILQQRGLFRKEYDYSTLRGHLGLLMPESKYSALKTR